MGFSGWVLVPVQTQSVLYIRTDLIVQGIQQGKFGKASHFLCHDGDGWFFFDTWCNCVTESDVRFNFSTFLDTKPLQKMNIASRQETTKGYPTIKNRLLRYVSRRNVKCRRKAPIYYKSWARDPTSTRFPHHRSGEGPLAGGHASSS